MILTHLAFHMLVGAAVITILSALFVLIDGDDED